MMLPRIWRALAGLFSELADQSAYTRYLRASGQAHSALAWRAFTDQRYRRKYQNAKCC